MAATSPFPQKTKKIYKTKAESVIKAFIKKENDRETLNHQKIKEEEAKVAKETEKRRLKNEKKEKKEAEVRLAQEKTRIAAEEKKKREDEIAEKMRSKSHFDEKVNKNAVERVATDTGRFSRIANVSTVNSEIFDSSYRVN